MSSREWIWGLLAGLLTALLWILSIPPFDFAEAAYIAFLPLLLWFFKRPDRRLAWVFSFAACFIAWLCILIWLRHVSLLGTLLLALILAAIHLPWFVLAWWIQPKLPGRSFPLRVFGCAVLASGWVVLEWVRSWFLWGFPWAPISLSQWERPVVLQVAAITGAYGISFLLIYFNCSVAQTLWIRSTLRQRKLWSGWFSPDLYVALGLLIGSVFWFFKVLPTPQSASGHFTAGVVQPYIPGELKWDEDRAMEHLRTLLRMTRFVAQTECEVLLWPEAATPWPVLGHERTQRTVESLSNELGKPLLMGNLAWKRVALEQSGNDLWQNGIFLVDPEEGLAEQYYVKRELVPFGEYIPRPFAFLKKFVPVGGDCSPGDGPGLIKLNLGDCDWRVGPLVCYEDTFPALARESARAGAGLFFVATNNAWYGEEGGAEQHAAHSVLRAVENRRPIMRCGNGGWSGWIDAYGTIREVLRDENGSIYFRGGGNYTVFQYSDWRHRQSYYTRHGDWFVVVSGAILLAGLAYFFFSREKA